MRFGQGQKPLKSATEIFQFIPAELRVSESRALRRKRTAQPLMQVFLKPGDVDIELKNFFSERMLAGKVLCAMDTPLPGGERRPIVQITLPLFEVFLNSGSMTNQLQSTGSSH